MMENRQDSVCVGYNSTQLIVVQGMVMMCTCQRYAGNVETWQTRKTIRSTNEFQRKGEEEEKGGGDGMG